MKRIFLLLGLSMLAGAMALAQDAPTSSPSKQNGQTRTQSSSRSTNIIRGCLSGSTGNYTVTDRNGMQYTVNGDDATLRSMVGREVEVTISEDRSTEDSTQAAGSSTHSTNAVQASNVRAVASSCNTTGNATTPSGSASPSATPDERPAPQMMAMLQQQAAPAQDNSKPNGAPAQVQSTPPVTSQTSASPNSPTTGANSQVGTSPANNSGMTESEANHDAQAARQGELNTNPQKGETTGRGVDNQGVNNPSTTNPNAVPTSPNSTSGNAQQPQANANDQNKPLYERQATDIPWAKSSGGNTNTPAPPH